MESFNFLAISDIHLGHRKVNTDSILENMKKVINDKLLTEIDMLIIAGDLFDRLLSYSDEEVLNIQRYFISLLSMCSTHNVSIRLLEGTPPHDRGQSKNLLILSKLPGLDIDILYVDKVCIEKNKKHSINILYVPDEWHPNPDQTWLDVMEELAFNELKSVDLSIMHGMFEHQVPPCCPTKPHSNTRYESITDGYIVVGHIHQPTVYGKVVAPGSFDRLTHGDEGNKGCWKINLSKNRKSNKVTFIENKWATKFITIDCCELSYDAAIEKISNIDAPPESHIRIKTYKTDSTLALLEWCKKTFYNYKWTVKIEDKKSLKIRNNPKIQKPQPHISITPNSIHPLLLERMKMKGYDESVISNTLKILKEII